MYKNDSDLFFCCSLIEFIGRTCKLKRVDVVTALGFDTVKRIYQHADILHCEPIEKTADVYINMLSIKSSDFDNIITCEYDVPDYWDIGKVYSRLVENIIDDTCNNISADTVTETIFKVYSSFISDSISNYNSDFFYQSREYIHECYKANTIL